MEKPCKMAVVKRGNESTQQKLKGVKRVMRNILAHINYRNSSTDCKILQVQITTCDSFLCSKVETSNLTQSSIQQYFNE